MEQNNLNKENISINNFSFLESNNEIQDYNGFFIQNLKSLTPDDYQIDEKPFQNNNYFSTKHSLIDKETNKEKSIEQTPESIENENKSLKETNISLKNDCNKEIVYKTETEKLKANLNEKSYLRRKRKNDYDFGKYNRSQDVNLRRKAKTVVLEYALDFLNEQIRKVYNNKIGNGNAIKKLLPINAKYNNDTTIQHNKDNLSKTLAEIFSENISTKYTCYPSNHNYLLIQRLLNEKDNDKRLYFKKIFNLTFLQCLKNFIGNDACKKLKEFKKFNEIKSKFTERDYSEKLKLYLINFVNIIDSKKGRKIKIEKNAKKEAKKGKKPKQN